MLQICQHLKRLTSENRYFMKIGQLSHTRLVYTTWTLHVNLRHGQSEPILFHPEIRLFPTSWHHHAEKPLDYSSFVKDTKVRLLPPTIKTTRSRPTLIQTKLWDLYKYSFSHTHKCTPAGPSQDCLEFLILGAHTHSHDSSPLQSLFYQDASLCQKKHGS